MIAGRVVINLAGIRDDACDEAREDRRKLEVLDRCPDGAEVLVGIGGRRHVTQDAAHQLHAHDQRLRITIEGSDPDAVQTFVRAARRGEWSAVA